MQLDAMKERSLPLPGGCWKRSIRLRQGPASHCRLPRPPRQRRPLGGNIADLALDGGTESYGPEDLRYEAYDDGGQYMASASSIRAALSVFAQQNRRIRWISEAIPSPEIEPEP
jgi:hypothetical protein